LDSDKENQIEVANDAQPSMTQATPISAI